MGVNVDHVATIRQARGTVYPDPLEAAKLAAKGGAASITIHLREDRRHIQDTDVTAMIRGQKLPVNLEMAVTNAMIAIACREKPKYACLVPERRAELTTEGGLDVAGSLPRVRSACRKLAHAGIQVALFIDPDLRQLDAAVQTIAPHLEIHTGTYCDAKSATERNRELVRIVRFARAAATAGFEVHAGHGLTLDNVGPIARIPEIVELNIGHSIVARALSVGLKEATAEMKLAMQKARR